MSWIQPFLESVPSSKCLVRLIGFIRLASPHLKEAEANNSWALRKTRNSTKVSTCLNNVQSTHMAVLTLFWDLYCAAVAYTHTKMIQDACITRKNRKAKKDPFGTFVSFCPSSALHLVHSNLRTIFLVVLACVQAVPRNIWGYWGHPSGRQEFHFFTDFSISQGKLFAFLWNTGLVWPPKPASPTSHLLQFQEAKTGGESADCRKGQREKFHECLSDISNIFKQRPRQCCAPASCRIVSFPVRSKKLCQSCTATPATKWRSTHGCQSPVLSSGCQGALFANNLSLCSLSVPCGECASCTFGSRCCASSGCWPWSWH